MRTAKSCWPWRAITGWKASSVWTVPLKLIDRGSMPCLVAAWAMIVRMRLYARTCVQSSFRTSSGVLQRKTSICSVCFSDLRSSSAFQRTVELREIVLGKLVGVQQCRGDDQRLDTKTWLLDTDSTFSDHQGLGKRLVGLPVDRTGLRRFEPGDNVIPFAQSLSTAKIRFAV